MVSNPNFYGQSTTGTPNQIEDGVDFPHTGLLKSLSLGIAQNYAISGFDITVDSATQIDVGAGVIFRDGVRVSISAVTNLTLISTYTNGYHLVVVNSSNAIVVRNPTAADKVAEYSSGDTIIAVVTHDGNNPMPIQYLTVNKTTHGVSIGYDSSGFTETGKITGSSSELHIEATGTNTDVKLSPSGTGDVLVNGGDLNLQDGTAENRGVITSATDKDINLAPGGTGQVLLGATGSTNLQLTTFGQRSLELSTNSATQTGKIIINAGSNGNIDIDPHGTGDVDIVSGDLLVSGGNIGVGTSSPSEAIHLSDADGGEPSILIENTGTNANEAEIRFYRTGASADSQDIGHIKFVGQNSASEDIQYAGIYADMSDETDGVEDGRLFFNIMKAGSLEEFLRCDANRVTINAGEENFDFKVAGDAAGSIILYTDATNERVGIGTSTPDVDLHIESSANPIVRIEETGQSGYVELTSLQDSQAQINAVNNTASEGVSLDLNPKVASAGTDAQEVRFFRDSRSTGDGVFTIKKPGTNTNVFQFLADTGTAHKVGFLGATAVTKQTVGNLAASTISPRPPQVPTASPGFEPGVDIYIGQLETEITNLRSKVDAIVDALQAFGLTT